MATGKRLKGVFEDTLSPHDQNKAGDYFAGTTGAGGYLIPS
jgi:hypothetical protein